MGHVHVPADDHRLFLVQLRQIGPEVILPAHPVVQALQLVLGVGGVHTDQIEIVIFQSDAAPLAAVLLHADVVAYRQRRMFCEDSGAGIALFLRIAPVALIAGQVQFDLSRLQFCLLEAEKVRVQAPEYIFKAFFADGPQAVYVPGNESHACSSLALMLSS